ncbi:MAG: cellulase family glycosylhydrolase [Halococcoides sp.]
MTDPMRPSTDGTASTATRRTFLKGAGATLAGGTVGTLALGTVGAVGIPTPHLERQENWMVDPSGNKVTLRGVNIPDAKRMNTKDFRPDTDTTIKRVTNPDNGWYPRVLRLPLQPTDIGGHNPGGIPPMPGFTKDQLVTYLEKHVDAAVQYARERNVYIIVDYHRHRGNSEAHQYDSPETDSELTMFWETVAPRYADQPHVLYEVYNEPIAPYQGRYDPNLNVDPTEDRAIKTWRWWKEAAQPWVDIIQEHAPETPVLIGSPRWTQWTYQAPRDEFSGDNLIYTGHVYAHPNLRPLSKYFGEPAKDVPVFMTEFGWGSYGAEWLKGTAEKEGEQFTSLFENFPQMSWTVWCFDAKWSPAMMDHDWSLNAYGKFWRDQLQQWRGQYEPGGSVTTTSETPSDATPTDTTATTTTDTTQGPPPIDGTVPQDVDGDGIYGDFNANGRIDFPDVNRFFQHSDTDAIQTNPGFFDIDGNGTISLQDVMALFQMV